MLYNDKVAAPTMNKDITFYHGKGKPRHADVGVDRKGDIWLAARPFGVRMQAMAILSTTQSSMTVRDDEMFIPLKMLDEIVEDGEVCGRNAFEEIKSNIYANLRDANVSHNTV